MLIGRRVGSRKRLYDTVGNANYPVVDSSVGERISSSTQNGWRALAPLNAKVELAWSQRSSAAQEGQSTSSSSAANNNQFLDESIWDEWLWGHDPLEEVSVSMMLNRMQMLGLLIARFVVDSIILLDCLSDTCYLFTLWTATTLSVILIHRLSDTFFPGTGQHSRSASTRARQRWPR